MASRRTTLGNITNQQPPQQTSRLSLASKAVRGPSLGGSLARGAENPGKTESRMSISTNRRSSTWAGVKQDMRPLADKSWLKKCATRVIVFLGARGYGEEVSLKQLLAKPTAKDFFAILSFLVGRIDSRYGALSGAPPAAAEDVLLLLKRVLCYPIAVSKMALGTVGSLHAWPNMLALLVWLIDLLEYDECARAAEQTDPADVNKFVLHLYAPWLRMDTDAAAAEFSASRAHAFFAQRMEVLQAAIAQQSQMIDGVRRDLAALLSQASAAQMKETLETYSSDIFKFHTLLGIDRQKREANLSVIRQSQTELKDLAAQHALALQQKHTLLAQVEAQAVNIEQYKKLRSAQEELSNSLHATTSQKTAVQQEVWNLEIVVSRKMVEADALIQQFNQHAKTLELPLGELTMTCNGSSGEVTTSLSFLKDGRVRSCLEQLRSTTSQKSGAAGGRLAALREQIEQEEERLTEHRDTVLALEAKAQSLKASQNLLREGMSEQLRTHAHEGESLNNQVATFMSQVQLLNQQLAASQDAFQATKEHHETLLIQQANERKVYSEDLLNYLNLLTAHKTQIQERVAYLDKQASQLLINVRAQT